MEFHHNKLFVGGISRAIEEDTLKSYFAKYGQVKEVSIVIDKATGMSKGFGFVIFKDPWISDKVLEDEHFILGKKVDVKAAISENREPPYSQEQNSKIDDDSINIVQYNSKKIFAGGLPPNINNEEFKKFFDRFGTITDAVVIHDKVTRRSRRFGFITFDSEDSVNAVLQNRFHTLNGYSVEVKKAEYRAKNDGHNRNSLDYRKWAQFDSAYAHNWDAIPYWYSYGPWLLFGGWGLPSAYFHGDRGPLPHGHPTNNYACACGRARVNETRESLIGSPIGDAGSSVENPGVGCTCAAQLGSSSGKDTSLEPDKQANGLSDSGSC